MITGKRHGDIATRVADDIKDRRFKASTSKPMSNMPPAYHVPSDSELAALELLPELAAQVVVVAELAAELVLVAEWPHNPQLAVVAAEVAVVHIR